jgi:diadenosine tetraphosphatase ApaH/serine/threonine PP2A family protein phosphatase
VPLAIISDIHANVEALEAVLGDIEGRGIQRIVCLGDVVGYGPNPRECVDLIVQRCELTLCGNHDQAVLYEPHNFNVGAERANYWTRQLFEDEPDKALRDRRWEFLGRLPVKCQMDNMLFVHGSPRRPVNEYLFAEDVYTNPQKLLANFERLEQKLCFVGHTHVPGVFTDDPYFDPPDELPEPRRYPFTEERAIINVGSVGQPRDHDTRASYAVIGEEDVEFVRVEYDIERTVRKIHDIPELDDFLGSRLLDGR